MMLGAINRLWSMSLQAGILILVVLAVRFFLKKYPKVYMYFLWMLVGVRLLCPVFVEAPFSLQPENIRPDGIVRSGEILTGGENDFEGLQPDDQGAQADILGKENNFSGGLPGDTNAGTEMGENGMYPLPSGKEADVYNAEDNNLYDSSDISDHKNEIAVFLQKIFGMLTIDPAASNLSESGFREIFGILVIVYLTGAGICFIFYTGQYLIMKHKVSTAVRGRENVWFSDRIDSPFVLGIIRPRIIMPYGLKRQEGYHILKHEQTHIKHHDPLIRLVGTLCICLHWWNPLVWLAVFKMNQDMEMFCDESVLRNASPEDKKSYARTLLAFAEKRSGLSVGLAFGESHTERRVRNLARKRKGGIVVTSLVMTLTVFCVAAFMTIPKIEAEGADGSGTGSVGNSGAQAGSGTDVAGNNGVQTGNNDHGGNNGNVQNASGSGNVTLTDEDKEYLITLCPKIPDFVSGEETVNIDFWKDFLFHYYTSAFERETVDRYVDSLGFEVPYVTIGYEEAQDTVEQIFGNPLSSYVADPRDLVWRDAVLYEEDTFYISVSDSPDYKYEYVYDTDTDILKEVELLEGLYDEEEYQNRVELYLLPADNERGFKIAGKERFPILQDTDSGMIKEQSFDVEFNPHGQVTFAAYAPNTELNPGEDVAFKLLQDGQVLYTFGGYGIRQNKDIWKFQNVAAVAFPDINGDGYTDVITIANYVSDKGTLTEETLSEARIYTGREGRYFIEETTLGEAYNNSHDQKTITDIQNFVSLPEYQDYFVRTSIYGRWKVTEHIPPAGIYALSDEEIESYENIHLEYGMYWYNLLSYDPDTANYTVENYRKETLSASEFEESFRTDVSAMGLSATELTYYELEGTDDSAPLFGQHFYQIDTDNALIYYEGVFFRAVRE